MCLNLKICLFDTDTGKHWQARSKFIGIQFKLTLYIFYAVTAPLLPKQEAIEKYLSKMQKWFLKGMTKNRATIPKNTGQRRI